MKTSVTELPFNTFIGLERATAAPYILSLPAGEQYLNHLGTVHASAQLSLAEATSGEFLLQHVGTTTNLIPVVRRLESKFRKPASGALKSLVSTPQADIDKALTEINKRGRAMVSIAVELYDDSATMVMSAVVEWFIARAATNTEDA